MKILKKLFKHSLTYNLYNFFLSIFYYFRDLSYVGDVFYGEDLNRILKKYLHVDFKKDWIGRLYGVINPSIDINGNFDINSQIIEIDNDNTNNEAYVKNWIFSQLLMVGSFFKLSNLYDFISIEIKHVGPVNADNFLIIFDIASRKDISIFFKKSLKVSILYLILIGIIVFVI